VKKQHIAEKKQNEKQIAGKGYFFNLESGSARGPIGPQKITETTLLTGSARYPLFT
jgi:hypothetical protein